MTVGAEIVLGWAPSLLSLLVMNIFIKPSSSGRCPLISRAATAMSMMPLLVQKSTPIESDFIWEIPVYLQGLMSWLLVIVVIARSAFIMSCLIESLLKHRPIQMSILTVELRVLLEGRILWWVEDPKLLMSLALWSNYIILIVRDLNHMVFSGKIRCRFSGLRLRAQTIVLYVWIKMSIAVVI